MAGLCRSLDPRFGTGMPFLVRSGRQETVGQEEQSRLFEIEYTDLMLCIYY